MTPQNSACTTIQISVTDSAGALGGNHPECGSHPGNSGLIKSATNWGGARAGAGRKPTPSVVIAGSGPRWYCVEVHRRAERQAVDGLEALGFVACAPEFMDMVPASTKRRTPAREMLRPAFPGYVLVELDTADPAWRQTASVRGVRRVMGPTPEHPQPIPAVHAAWLLSQFGEGGVQRQTRLVAGRAEPLPADAHVEIIAGPLAGVRGVVNASDGRAVVLLVGGRRVRMAQVAVRLA